MEYISAKEFLKQPKEVQKVFLKWWEPQAGDLYFDKELNSIYMVLDKQDNMNTWENLKNNKLIVPLLTEGQLRGFIQDKTDCYVEILHSKERKIGVTLVNKESISPEKLIPTEEQNVLHAYWEVACRIAKAGDLNAGTM